MLSEKQLELAVSRGIVTREQVEALNKLASDPTGEQAAGIDFSVAADDEPFRLLKGFRDFFIAIGIVILAVGLSMFIEGPFDLVFDARDTLVETIQAAWIATFSVLVLTSVAIVISEWVTRSQRLPLSSLVLTLVFALWAGLFAGSFAYSAGLSLGVGPDGISTLKSVVTFAGIFGAVFALIWYYRRYKLPFVLLPLAGIAVFGVATMLDGMFDLDHDLLATRLTYGICGIAVFAAAMWYDMKDRYRASRLSECAFWLHLLAAPMIVHSVLFEGLDGAIGSITMLLVVALLAIFALIIDRRAMLVSALIYLGYSLFTIADKIGFLGEFDNSIALVVLGLFVLGLGLGWTQIRRFFVTNLVWKSLRDKLPPVVA